MKYRVVVVMSCTYIVEAENPDEAETLAMGMREVAAEDITIIETTVDEVQ